MPSPVEVRISSVDHIVDPSGDFYGDLRLIQQLAAPPPAASDIATSLLTEVLDFQHGVSRDDIAIVALRVPA